MSRPAPEVSKMLFALRSDADARELLFDFVGHKGLCFLANTNQAFRHFTETSRFPRHTTEGRKEAERLHFKARELLFCVLNTNTDANRKQMDELLVESQAAGHQSIILTRVSSQEFYSNAQNQILPRANRVWTHPISPLEAVFKCGDFHLVRRLLARIPENQKREALVQLQNAKTECAANIPGNYLYDLARLSAAYKEYLGSYDNLVQTNNSNELNRLWGCIGEAQKNLSWFLLQVFCNPSPHDPLPNFNLEPRRDCRLRDNTTFDLDSIGLSSSYALYKGRRVGVEAVATPISLGWWGEPVACFDLPAINSLCDVVQRELDQTTVALSMEVNALEEQRQQMRLR